MTRPDTPLVLYRLLKTVWSAETASPSEGWNPDNPARNHCSVTALIVQDHFGGELLCTRTTGGTHFYNRIDGRDWDLTVSQFAEPIPYDATPASREMALNDTTPAKYRQLSDRLAEVVRRT